MVSCVALVSASLIVWARKVMLQPAVQCRKLLHHVARQGVVLQRNNAVLQDRRGSPVPQGLGTASSMAADSKPLFAIEHDPPGSAFAKVRTRVTGESQ